MLQEETIRRSERERKANADKLNNLERQLASSETEKQSLSERLSKSRASESRLLEDKQRLKKIIDEGEMRMNDAEVSRRAYESELQRVQSACADKETECGVLRERLDATLKQLHEAEDRAQSLQLSIDRLSLALAKYEEGESSLKNRLQSLNYSLNQQTSQQNDLHDKLAAQQGALASSESDRRILQVFSIDYTSRYAKKGY